MNRILHWSGSVSGGQVNLLSKDSITLPVDSTQVIYGIDNFTVDSLALHFEIFGSAGLRALVSVSRSGILLNYQYLGFADSLDLSASCPGMYGTLQGQILDSSLGWKAVSIGSQPISLVDSIGAVGNGGLFALKSQGSWRAYPQQSDNLRDYSLSLQGPQDDGYWGTHATLWNNRDSSYDHFIKDDSTVWADVSVSPPQAITKDSILVFHSSPDSIRLGLYDADSNYSHPTVSWIHGSNQPSLLKNLWVNFSKGCGVNEIDSVACYWGATAPTVSLRWNSDSVHFFPNLNHGSWVEILPGEYMPVIYDFVNQNVTVDTTLAWSPGDTIRVRFSNASFSLVHAEPVALEPLRAPTIFQVRLIGKAAQWERPGSTLETIWEIRDVRGRPLLQGRDSRSGGMILWNQLPSGVFDLSFQDKATHRLLWRGSVVSL